MGRIGGNTMRDVVFNQPASKIRAAAFKVLADTGRFPAAQLVGSAVILILICKHYQIRVADVLALAGNLINESLSSAGDPKGHIRAAWEYIKNELPT
jgi:hypothetical protein